MARGKKTPTAIKKLSGTFRADESLDNEMETTLVTKANEVSRESFINDAAFSEWERIYSELGNINILMITDITALLMLCNNVGIYQNCINILKGGLTSITPNGHEQQRPEVNTMIKMQESYYKGCAKFGLTPADRMKIEMPKQKAKDGFDELL